MKVFAIGSCAKPITDEQRKQIMQKEVPDTLKLYHEGKIEQFWFREDKPGVIFLMNTSRSIKLRQQSRRCRLLRTAPWVRVHSGRSA
jgi:hypothetical protein